MPFICHSCREEKAKSLMHTTGVGGGTATCKACHRDGKELDRYSVLRQVENLLHALVIEDRHYVIKALRSEHAL